MASVDGFADGAVAIGGLTDVGQVADQPGHRRSEVMIQIGQGGGSILHGIMQPGGGKHFRVIAHRRDQISHGLQVDLIGVEGVFASVIDPAMGSNGK